MATVYLAHDVRHDRRVALKVLKPELAAVVGADRFLAEIKTTANLQHPHILPLFDSGAADSFLFYVMPYVEGESLRDRLDREHQLPVDDAVKIATNLAEALDYAHRKGVIHRDIKPANVLLLDGKPVLADFGIALAVGVAGGGRLTETGLSLGTPHYMSPEQATGNAHVGPASDIYALGCVLYEMLVGEPPYTGSTAQAVLGKIIAGEAVSARKSRATIPANVDAAIRRALEKLPADRFTGAQDFAKALADSGFRHGEVAGVAAGKGPWNRLTVIGWSVAALAILVAGWALLRQDAQVPVARYSIALPPEQALALPTTRNRFALSPDGAWFVYVGVSDGGGQQLFVRPRNQLTATPLPGTEGAINASVSPDGSKVAFAAGQGNQRMRLMVSTIGGGGAPLMVTDSLVDTGGVSWGHDGYIYYDGHLEGDGLARVREGGGTPEPVTITRTEDGELWHTNPHALPNGRGVLFDVRRGLTLDAAVVDLATGDYKVLVPGASGALYSPTGHLVYVSEDGALMAAPFDQDELTLTGDAVALAGGAAPSLALAGDGTLLYLQGSSPGGTGLHQLLVVDLEGNEEPLVLAPRNIGSVGWSPDGRSVVYSSEAQIYTYNVVLGTTPRQLTFEGNNQNPVFSPDGTRVAFSSIREGTAGFDVFVKNLNDDSPPRSILTLDANQLVTQWPADSLIVFERGSNLNRDLWTVDLSDPDSARAEAYLSAEADLRYMVVSPDGTLAAYTSNESGQFEIYIRSFPDPGVQTIVSQGGGGTPFWSPDGNTLYYSRLGGTFTAARIERNPVPVVVSRDSLFTAPQTLRPFQGSGLHPDGDRFILARGVAAVGTGEGAAEPERFIMVTNFFAELKRLVPN